MKFRRVIAGLFGVLISVSSLFGINSDAPESDIYKSPEAWARYLASSGQDTISPFFRALLTSGKNKELLASLSSRLLVWEGRFELNGRKRRVLIFHLWDSPAGSRILVITDESLNALIWRNIQPGAFVELGQDNHRPVLIARARSEQFPFFKVQRYWLSLDTVEEYGAPYYEYSVPSKETKEERDFYSEVKRSGSEELRNSLGITPPKREKWLGEPDSPDFEKHFDAQFLGLKRLKWSSTFGRGNVLRRVLIFDAGFEEWPGFQYITIVLTDPEYRVRAWRIAGGKQKFREAELLSKPETKELNVTYWEVNRQVPAKSTLSTEQYSITADEIGSSSPKDR